MIRRVKKEDLDTLIDLSIQFHSYFDKIYGDELNPKITSETDIKDTLIAGFNDDKHDILVLEIDGRVIGFADLWTYPEFVHSGNSAYIQNLFIIEEFRGQGWGKKLIEELIQIAKLRRATAIHVTTSKKNIKAIQLYKKMGIADEGVLLERSLEY